MISSARRQQQRAGGTHCPAKPTLQVSLANHAGTKPISAAGLVFARSRTRDEQREDIITLGMGNGASPQVQVSKQRGKSGEVTCAGGR